MKITKCQEKNKARTNKKPADLRWIQSFMSLNLTHLAKRTHTNKSRSTFIEHASLLNRPTNIRIQHIELLNKLIWKKSHKTVHIKCVCALAIYLRQTKSKSYQLSATNTFRTRILFVCSLYTVNMILILLGHMNDNSNKTNFQNLSTNHTQTPLQYHHYLHLLF